jgi:hypothetical protein
MSATTLDTTKPAIIAASTPRDVIVAMKNDPAIRSSVLNAFVTLAGTSFVGSRTVWVAVLTPIISALVAHFGFNLDEATSAEVAAGLTSLAGVVMRLVTKTPITSALPVAAPTVGPTP